MPCSENEASSSPLQLLALHQAKAILSLPRSPVRVPELALVCSCACTPIHDSHNSREVTTGVPSSQGLGTWICVLPAPGAATWSQILQIIHSTATLVLASLPAAPRWIRNPLPTRICAYHEHTSWFFTKAAKKWDAHRDFSYKLAQSLACRKALCCCAKAPGSSESSPHPKSSSSVQWPLRSGKLQLVSRLSLSK